MRKIACILLAALLLTLCGCGEKAEGPKFIHTVCHQEFLKNGVVTGTDDFFYTYDDRGYNIRSEGYRDGQYVFHTVREYDAFGHPSRITTEREDGSLQIITYENTLDDEGRILRQERRTDGVLTTVREITYNRHGQEATHHVTAWHKDGQLDGSGDYTMTYNWKGQLTRQVHLRDNGEEYVWEYQDGLCVRETAYAAETHAVTYYWEYTYDEKDRCTRLSRYAGDGTPEQYHEYVYDDEAQTQTSTSYLADGTVDAYSDVYTYDAHGNQILLERYKDGRIYQRIRDTYELLETVTDRS